MTTPTFDRHALKRIATRDGEFNLREKNLAAFALSLMAERDEARRELAEAEEAIRLIERITVTYEDARGDGESEGVAKIGQQFLDHPAVRRALARKKKP